MLRAMFGRLRSRRRRAAADPDSDSRTHPCSDAKAHLKGNPLEAAVDLMTLLVSQDGTILLSMNGELKTATITYYKSTDDADYYKFGDSGDIICSYTYDNDLVYLAITPNDVMIQFMRAD